MGGFWSNGSLKNRSCALDRIHTQELRKHRVGDGRSGSDAGADERVFARAYKVVSIDGGQLGALFSNTDTKWTPWHRADLSSK